MSIDLQTTGTGKPKKRKTLSERLEAAKAREAKAAETLRLRKVKAQKYEAQQRLVARSHDTRRKIIAGALALKHRELDGIWARTLHKLLDEYVVTDQDRALFDLAPLAADDRRRKQPKAY